MTQRSDRPLVGQEPALKALYQALDRSNEGPQVVLLSGASGSGRGALAASFLARLREDQRPFTLVPLHHQQGDDGVRSLLRVYGSTVTAIARSEAFDKDPCESLEESANSCADQGLATRLRAIAQSATELRGAVQGEGLKIKLPPGNPYQAIIEALEVLGPRCPWIVDLRAARGVTSPGFWTFLSVLVGRSRARNWKMLLLLSPGDTNFGEKPGEDLPGPAAFQHALFNAAELVAPPSLNAKLIAELLAATYQPNDFPSGLAIQLAELCGGRAELLHQLLDALEEDETITWNEDGYQITDLEDVDLDVLVPMVREEHEEQGSEEAEQLSELLDDKFLEKILHVAAIEGELFTASLIRTYLNAGEDEIDDALDSMPHIVEEGSYDETLGTWSYRFRYSFYRDWYRSNPPAGSGLPEQPQIAAALGRIILQSYAPASIEFVARGAQIFCDAGDHRGARNLLAMAMGSDRPELCDFAIELCESYSDSPFPPGLERLLYCGSADRAVNGLPAEAATSAIERASRWAKDNEEPSALAYMELLRCRMKVREGKAAEARALGDRAAELLLEAGDKVRAGETFNQLAMIALGVGDSKAASAYLQRAQKASTIPPVLAHTQYIEAIVNKRAGQLSKAASGFGRAVGLATEAGNLLLALESMLGQAEASLVTGKGAEIAPLLERAIEIARAVKNPPRERLAARLLCQAEAARGQLEAAYEVARHALDLTRDLGDGGEEGDLYHCGVFATMAGKEQEGLDFLETARDACAEGSARGLLPEVLFNIAQIKLRREEFGPAQSQLEQALSLVAGGADRGRELRVLESLGQVLSMRGDHQGAASRYKQAADRAVGPQAKQLRASLRKRIAEERKRAASG